MTDQIAIKEDLSQKKALLVAKQGLVELDQIRPILVSLLVIFGGQNVKERKEERKEEKKKKRKSKGIDPSMDHYVFVTLSMEKYDLYGLYGSVCTNISGPIPRV